MNKLLFKLGLTLAILLYLICARECKAQGGFKHGAIAGAMSFGITSVCTYNLKDRWGCYGIGIMTSVIAAAVFEAMQNDMHDAGNDIAASALGASVGAGFSLAIDF